MGYTVECCWCSPVVFFHSFVSLTCSLVFSGNSESMTSRWEKTIACSIHNQWRCLRPFKEMSLWVTRCSLAIVARCQVQAQNNAGDHTEPWLPCSHRAWLCRLKSRWVVWSHYSFNQSSALCLMLCCFKIGVASTLQIWTCSSDHIKRIWILEQIWISHQF